MRRNLVDLHVGEAFGRYELLLPIAEGGMSRVWAARLRGTRGFQKVVAIKTLCADRGNEDQLEDMLLAEARLAAQIQHPNVAQYLDLGERDGVLFVVMEWVDGESLTQILRSAGRGTRMPLPIAAQIVAKACNGLHAAHELTDNAGEPLGLVHCDVSPHNLMIGANGAVKLIDFGIAKATRGAPMSDNDGRVAGKLAFMAPEQARGEELDRRADIFSLGIVLYLLTTGRHPFGFGTPAETLQRIVRNAPIIPPCAADPDYPPALERVVLWALAHDRGERFATAAEMLYELSAAVELAHELELGAFVHGVCELSLRERRAAISEALERAAVREESDRPPSTPSAPSVSGELESAPELAVLQAQSTNAPAATDVLLSSLPKRRSSWRYLGVIAALGAALGVLAFRSRWLATPPAPAAQPLAQSAALPSAAPRPESPPTANAPEAVSKSQQNPAAAASSAPALRSSPTHKWHRCPVGTNCAGSPVPARRPKRIPNIGAKYGI